MLRTLYSSRDMCNRSHGMPCTEQSAATHRLLIQCRNDARASQCRCTHHIVGTKTTGAPRQHIQAGHQSGYETYGLIIVSRWESCVCQVLHTRACMSLPAARCSAVVSFSSSSSSLKDCEQRRKLRQDASSCRRAQAASLPFGMGRAAAFVTGRSSIAMPSVRRCMPEWHPDPRR